MERYRTEMIASLTFFFCRTYDVELRDENRAVPYVNSMRSNDVARLHADETTPEIFRLALRPFIPASPSLDVCFAGAT